MRSALNNVRDASGSLAAAAHARVQQNVPAASASLLAFRTELTCGVTVRSVERVHQKGSAQNSGPSYLVASRLEVERAAAQV